MMQKAYYRIVHSNIVIIIHIEDIEEMDHTRALSAKTPDGNTEQKRSYLVPNVLLLPNLIFKN